MAEQTIGEWLIERQFHSPKRHQGVTRLGSLKKKAGRSVASEKNRMIKTLEDGNIKLNTVLSDVDGVSGTKMMNALIDGETDIDKLIKHVHGKVKANRGDIRKALEGRLTVHHRFMLQTIRESINQQEAIIAKVDAQIQLAGKAYETEIGLLATIDGIGKESAIVIVSEIGVNMSQFRITSIFWGFHIF